MSQNLKFKIKQFQWFEMQTKVRQIIQQVLGPLQKRILQTANTVHKVKINQTQDEDKINQITLMIANDPRVFQTGIFQNVGHRFEEQTKYIEELSRQITQGSKYVDEKFKILDIRMEQSSEVLRNVASLRERISKQIELQTDNINNLRTNFTEMTENLNTEIKESRRVIQNNFQYTQKDHLLTQQIIKKINMNIQDIEGVLQNHRQMHREKSIKLEDYIQTLNRHQEEINNLEQSKKMTKKLEEIVKQMDNELTRAEFKIDNISPLITQAQISDCLFNVLPTKLKKKISIHQYKKYYQFNRDVLQKPYKQIHNKFQGYQLLQEMQKRNTKEIVQLKRKKLLAMGIDIDHLTYEQRQRYYSQISLDDGLDDEDEEVKVSNKIDQKQIFNIIKGYFNDFTTSVSQKINIELRDSKKYIYTLEQELRHELQSYEKTFQSIKSQCETFQTQQLLQNKNYDQNDKKFDIQIEKLKFEFNSLKNLQRLFYNFCSLVNHLEIQDQIDKQNISLMGVQENTSQDPAQVKERNSVIQLDKKCFSCCGYPASTLSAFKMACLTYNPSAIRIDSKEYRREQLLQFTTNMLHNIKKSIQSEGQDKEWQFSRPNLQKTKQKLVKTLPRQSFETYERSKIICGKVNTQQGDIRRSTYNNRFRTTKKYISSNNVTPTGKYNTKAHSNNKTTINEDMNNLSVAFTELKRRNISFLC